MKNSPIRLIAVLASITIIQSCTKSSVEPLTPTPIQQLPSDEFVNISVATGKPYTFVAGQSGTLLVSQQASHSQISATGLDEGGRVIYSYTSLTGYVGPDQVTLSYDPKPTNGEPASTCPNHASGSSSIALIITVTE